MLVQAAPARTRAGCIGQVRTAAPTLRSVLRIGAAHPFQVGWPQTDRLPLERAVWLLGSLVENWGGPGCTQGRLGGRGAVLKHMDDRKQDADPGSVATKAMQPRGFCWRWS